MYDFYTHIYLIWKYEIYFLKYKKNSLKSTKWVFCFVLLFNGLLQLQRNKPLLGFAVTEKKVLRSTLGVLINT